MNQNRLVVLACLAVVAAIALPASEARSHPQHDGPHFCPKASPDLRVEGGDFEAERLVGLRMKRARTAARRHGCTVRVVRLDGKWLAVTDDFGPDRINVEVEEERIKRINGIY